MPVTRRKKMMAAWTPKQTPRELPGSVHMFLLAVLTALFVSGGGYLYAVNQSAVQGYHMRTLEKEIDALKQKNAELRIAEADLRSLSRIESAEGELEMQKLDNVKYIEERESAAPVASEQGVPVALR